MKSFIVILSCLAVTIANPTSNLVEEYLANGRTVCRQRSCNPNTNRVNPWDDCPIVNCPPAVRDGQCGLPDCSLPGNRLRLHPHIDPNFYYQCAPINAIGTLAPFRRPCACGTLFSAVVDENRCVHPEEWRPDCPGQVVPPTLSEEFCRPECPTCDDDGNLPGPTLPPPPPSPTWPPPPSPTLPPPPSPTLPPPPSPTLPPPPSPTLPPPPSPTLPPPPSPTLPPPNGNCPCICVCIWWPCQPCPSNCACNNNNNNNNVNNQSPWAPQPPQQQQPWAPQPPQNNPWQQPQQPWQPQPIQRFDIEVEE